MVEISSKLVPKVNTFRRKTSHRILIYPPLLYLLLLYIIPVGMMVLYSFWSTDPQGEVIRSWSFEQYSKIFLSPVYLKTLAKSLLMAFSVTVLCLSMAYPVAFYIARIAPNRIKYLLLLLIIVPSWVSFLIRTYSWMIMLGEKGMLNFLLVKFGLLSEPFSILFSLPAVFIGLAHIYFPFMFLPIFVSIEKIPSNILEMAECLGASMFQKIRRVILPMSMPGIVSGAIIVFVPSIGEYVIPMILGGSKGLMYGNLIQSSFGTLNWPLGAALAVFLLIIVLSVFFTFTRFYKIQDIWGG